MAAKRRNPAIVIALALLLAIVVAVPVAATIPAVDIGAGDLELVATSPTSSPLLAPAELSISLPPPGHAPPALALEDASDHHFRIALAIAFARAEAKNRIRGRAAFGSIQLFGNMEFKVDLAPGVRNGPSMYQGFGSSPLNFSDPLGLCKACGIAYRVTEFMRSGDVPADVEEALKNFGIAAGEEAAAMAVEELSPVGIANGLSGVFGGYDFVRDEAVIGWKARGLSGLAAIPIVPSLIRKVDVVVEPLRKVGGNLDAVRHAERTQQYFSDSVRLGTDSVTLPGYPLVTGGAGPKLTRLHPDSYLKPGTLDHFRSQSTDDIVSSLRKPGPERLTVRPDGTVLQGNHRIKVLEERGFDTSSVFQDAIVMKKTPLAPWE